jgi:1,4-dihydroxy-2-naphthoate octaprenyltransferase
MWKKLLLPVIVFIYFCMFLSMLIIVIYINPIDALLLILSLGCFCVGLNSVYLYLKIKS